MVLVFQMNHVTDEEMQEHYDNFFEDVFVECEDKVRALQLFKSQIHTSIF